LGSAFGLVSFEDFGLSHLRDSAFWRNWKAVNEKTFFASFKCEQFFGLTQKMNDEEEKEEN
jgi:hypothetical protein